MFTRTERTFTAVQVRPVFFSYFLSCHRKPGRQRATGFPAFVSKMTYAFTGTWPVMAADMGYEGIGRQTAAPALEPHPAAGRPWEDGQ
jgi:hypothetical protein